MNKFFTILMICMYYSVSAVHTSKAQFNPTYSNDGTYYMRDIYGDTVYGYKRLEWFMFNGDWLMINKGTPDRFMYLNSNKALDGLDSIPWLRVSGRPNIPSISGKQDYSDTLNWDATMSDLTWTNIQSKPTFATVATTGDYGDLSGKPVNVSTWVNDAGYITSAALSGYATTSELTAGLATKFNSPSGTTAQYIRGDGSLATFPTIPAQFNPIQGTGVTISGSYPNMTFSAASSIPTYSKSALLSNAGVLITDTFTVASATPTISFASILSTVGKSNFKIIAVTGYRSAATATTSPQVSVTAITSNSATFNITQQNTATVTILSINVLSGLPLILAPDPQNVKLIVSLIAY